MNKLIITCGISGSGKSTWTKKYHPYAYIINPDSIRKELTGNVSDQSKNKEVFEVAYKSLCMNGAEAGTVVWDATNLSISGILKIVNMAKGANIARCGKTLDDVTVLVFKDSLNWELCLERVKKAIANGEDRSNTDVEVDDGNGSKIPLLKSMYNRFNNFWYLLTAPNGISDFNREGIKVEVYEP